MPAALHAAPVTSQGSWGSLLQSRDLNGDGQADAFYDSALDITWLRDAGAAGGPLGFAAARDWAAALVVNGVGGWRLPTVVDMAAPGCDFSYGGGTDCGYNVVKRSRVRVYSEFAFLWYDELGLRSACAVTGLPGVACVVQAPSGLSNTAEFDGLRVGDYWLDGGASGGWTFDTGSGLQTVASAGGSAYAIAVRKGDILARVDALAVPEPRSTALVAVALLGLAVASRRRNAAARVTPPLRRPATR